MTKPIPLSDLAEILDACGNSPLIEFIREAFRRPGIDMALASQAVRHATFTRLGSPDAIAADAFYHYALHESGALATTSARLHHRARFYRCYRLLVPKST